MNKSNNIKYLQVYSQLLWYKLQKKAGGNSFCLIEESPVCLLDYNFSFFFFSFKY